MAEELKAGRTARGSVGVCCRIAPLISFGKVTLLAISLFPASVWGGLQIFWLKRLQVLSVTDQPVTASLALSASSLAGRSGRRSILRCDVWLESSAWWKFCFFFFFFCITWEKNTLTYAPAQKWCGGDKSKGCVFQGQEEEQELKAACVCLCVCVSVCTCCRSLAATNTTLIGPGWATLQPTHS